MRILVLFVLMLSACSSPGLSLLNEDDSGSGVDDGSDGSSTVVFPKNDMGHKVDLGACKEGAVDLPDSNYFDANCDGIDGDLSQSVFVASYGDDSNPGTKASPKKTIQAAIDIAATEGKTWVLISDGIHDGGFTLSAGVSLAGGFGFGWKRSRGARTAIRGGNPAIQGLDINLETFLLNLDVQPGKAQPGETVTTIALTNCTGVVFDALNLVGGIGGDGSDGDMGTDGEPGKAGEKGENAPDDSNRFGICKNQDNPPSVGAGAPRSCGMNAGGTGGKAGFKKNAGKKGGDSEGGTVGGTGGPQSTPGVQGAFGDNGDSGTSGVGGKEGGGFTNFVWKGNDGTEGEAGIAGPGGSGGGGGGGGYEKIGCDSWGGAGGGGGSGGCGGSGGAGGKAAGASVVLFLVNSPNTKILNSRFTGGQGGHGGRGGQGGKGGIGGKGGKGGNHEENSGRGARGGQGGAGGIGGSGGAGAGGPSFGIFSDQKLVPSPVATDVTEGIGGQGGNAPTAEGKGAKGIAEAIHIGAY